MKLISYTRIAWRGTRFIFHLTTTVFRTTACRLRHGQDWHQTGHGQTLIRHVMQAFSKILGLHISCYGRPLATQVLFVSNHISFLDIIAISSVVPTRFLAKHNIRYWPVIGYLTAISGSLFIRRDNRRQLQNSLNEVIHALTEQRPLLIFPEGTTSLGNRVLKFHSSLFQSSIDASVPVQPITLHYRHKRQPDRLAAYIDQDNFLLTLLKLMARPQTEVHVSFTPAIDSREHNRRSLAAFCHARISQNLAYQLQCDSEFLSNSPGVNSSDLGEYQTEI